MTISTAVSRCGAIVWALKQDVGLLQDIYVYLASLMEMLLLNMTADVIYQTRERVLPRFQNTKKWAEKPRHIQVFFNQLRGVLKLEEELFLVFDIASQTLEKLFKVKLTKLYAHELLMSLRRFLSRTKP